MAIARTNGALAALLVLAAVVHGARALAPFHIRGDLLYHWGLTNTLLLGSFPPDGPYAGLPAYYPPAFHALLASLSGGLGLDLRLATALLGIAWLPVIPLGAYLLTRRVTGRRDVALLAAALTAFGGAFDLSADRLWVNSMFMAGHSFYPIYPRDLVFGLLPFAVLAFLRAADSPGRSAVGWAAVGGILLGICALLQIQLLLPIPAALALFAVVVGWRRRAVARMLTLLMITGGVALAIATPWLGYIADLIVANGGVSIDSSEELLPARIGFWSYPIQFGLILPLAIVGTGLVLILVRRSRHDETVRAADHDLPRRASPTWTARRAEDALVLLPWSIVPFCLAMLYQPSWPLEDALRPQRMWLVSSQPALILAAMGLVAIAEVLIRRRPDRRRLVVAALVGAILVATVPTTLATERQLWMTWREPSYAHLALERDRVPDMAELLPVSAPRPTVLTYEDWSSLVWYETGAAVVAVEPPGYAKLAFDPGVFTGHAQADRRRDLARALRGNTTDLTEVADRYDARRVVFARRGDLLGLIAQPAVVAAEEPGALSGTWSTLEGNGWDAVILEAGASLAFPVDRSWGSIELDLRVLTRFGGAPVGVGGSRRLRILAGERPVADIAVLVSGSAEFDVVTTTVTLEPGGPLVVEAIDAIALQSITGFVTDPGPVSGWRLAASTDEAVVWERVR